ncbi:hypothetical protein A2Z22_03685 [Candidatus Woesebacteria bacterium RBG_16_34_12]|uniref:Uncharacterized protein n=1 Tax=Candidatus Woesebacteria bacterium RBG_16_34_12 TaxID=1802480 RepID=A0A1F7X7R2_9BACT|nr:MAG: hypothetical protein A2Z22_03685 [Candidatus Woesebacteria bacterium RBG_16_34_12]
MKEIKGKLQICDSREIAIAAEKLRDGQYELTIYPNRLHFTQWGMHPKDRICLVEYRSISEYEERVIPKGLAEEIVNKDLQLVEPGAGLAEFVPKIALQARKRPIVIDPLDYEAIRSLLEGAQEIRKVNQENRQLIQELLRRIDIYLDPGLVRLFNMNLDQACKEYPYLEGIADIVVDVGGPLLYSDDPEKTYQLESNWLLRKNPPGRFYHP